MKLLNYTAALAAVSLLAFPAGAQPRASSPEGLPPAIRQAIASRVKECWQFDAQDWKGIQPSPIGIRIDYDPSGKARNVKLSPRDEERYRREAAFRVPALKALQAAAVCDMNALHLPQNLYPTWKSMEFAFDPMRAVQANGKPRPKDPDADLRQGLGVMEVK